MKQCIAPPSPQHRILTRLCHCLQALRHLQQVHFNHWSEITYKLMNHLQNPSLTPQIMTTATTATTRPSRKFVTSRLRLLAHAIGSPILRNNKYCPACSRAKLTRRPARSTRRSTRPPLTKSGELVTADHVVANRPESSGLTGERDALEVVDRYSNYMDVFPLMTTQRKTR